MPLVIVDYKPGLARKYGGRGAKALNIPWPEEQLQRCIELWRKGRNAKEIGAEIGKSKNAIIGRMRRMRIDTADPSLLRKQPVDRTKPKAPKVPKAKPFRKELPHIRGKLWMPATPPPIGKTACQLMELTLKTCRWPVGEATGEFQLFCGLPEASLEDNRPYCEGHSQVAYREVPNEHHRSDTGYYRRPNGPGSATRHFRIR